MLHTKPFPLFFTLIASFMGIHSHAAEIDQNEANVAFDTFSKDTSLPVYTLNSNFTPTGALGCSSRYLDDIHPVLGGCRDDKKFAWALEGFQIWLTSKIYHPESPTGNLKAVKDSRVLGTNADGQYPRMMSTEDAPAKLSFRYQKLDIHTDWFIGPIWAFQMVVPGDVEFCLSSIAYTQKVMRPYNDVWSRSCKEPGSPAPGDIEIPPAEDKSPILSWLTTLFVAVQAGNGNVQIRNVGDFINGYWTCLENGGRIGGCNNEDDSQWWTFQT
ncbi:hypothetical protein BJ684DRAFT_15794 [Piptocephalis cylindrospora]|uniref:Uncharacterized protein n=1 Tax=Piptocephalis cylindrospora TaxID=1907219 RepID=A0A4P9Y4I5_9FUNG|nr:hypothetical protein BJ684DRAFT_15794 [Piptocephalis cylindrospora]|eukprot:RKP13847.1 hypothetical protein BJ684DRAFT_15794 [Piptocephalis cylindrospora]